MVHNKYIHIGVFWTYADPPPRRLSCPPLAPNFIGLELPLVRFSDVYNGTWVLGIQTA